MTRPGEHLYLSLDGDRLGDPTDWATEVEACAHHDAQMPERVVAICLSPPSIRDLTRDFEAAVVAAQREEDGFPGTYGVTATGRAA